MASTTFVQFSYSLRSLGDISGDHPGLRDFSGSLSVEIATHSTSTPAAVCR